MLLNENIDPNNQKLAKLKKGDRISIAVPNRDAENAIVQHVNGNEFLMYQPKTKNHYRFYKTEAIEGDKFHYYPGKQNAKSTISFTEIFVYDSTDTDVVKFRITPIDPNQEEPEEELSPEEQELLEALENERKEIFAKAQDVEEGDKFSMMFGEVEEDEDGNGYSGRFKDKTTAQAFFQCKYVYEEVIIATLIKVDGAEQKHLEPLIGNSISFKVDERSLFHKSKEGIIVKGFTDNRQEVYFKYVYYFNVQANDEDGDSENSISQVKPEFNKDLMRLIHHRTWKDRLFGKEGKGIIPLEKIRSKFLDGSVKGKKYVTFILDRDVIVGTGKNLQIKKNEETYGKMHDSGRIVVHGKNGKQTIHLFLQNTNDTDTYKVRIESRDANNKKEVMGNGTLTMVKA